MNARNLTIFPPPSSLATHPGSIDDLPPIAFLPETLPAGGYRLHLRSRKGVLAFSDEGGRQAGLSTIAQLKDQLRVGPIPELDIEDVPRLKVRGFMLDISRGKVPNRQTLEELVQILWKLKFNQLQLYMEHTFAYTGHDCVWREAAPWKAEDLLWLDDHCALHGIELVPNQNCFGHMEKWLCHDAYKPLAECPAGFEHPLSGWKETGSVLRPGPPSARFIDGLLSELLPCFRSRQVNIGCDETWELGQGASCEAVQRHGKRQVFLAHLHRLLEVVRSHDKEAQFWADVFLGEEGESVGRIEGATALVWGYEPGHPFASDLGRLSASGQAFLVAPGTSCWNSFGGRWDAARDNIRQATEACLAFGGDGLLLTSWGDNGHAYPFAVMLPPLVLAAACAWNGSCDEAAMTSGLELVFGPNGLPAARALIDLGCLDRAAGAVLPNMSGIFRAALNIQTKGLDNPFTADPGQVESARSSLSQIRAQLKVSPPPTATTFLEEILLAADLTDFALARAAGVAAPPILIDLERRFLRNWEFRSQSGIPSVLSSGFFRYDFR